MATSGFSTATSWHFPNDVGKVPGTFTEDPEPPQSQRPPSSDAHNPSPTPSTQLPPRKQRTHWPPRTCRICLETVHPTISTPDSLPSVLQSTPHVTYTSSDPELGRLLRPCKCKGTSKYVHEGCLQAWRHADPGYGKRNYWQCPTCGHKYRLERLNWGARISNTFTHMFLTILVFALALFLMGFVADPIINLYAEPTAIIWSPRSIGDEVKLNLSEEDVPSWGEHFLKGLASLGLLGFVKVLIGMSPWNWLNIRFGGGNRAGNTGRDRMSQISWVVVFIGVCTFLWAVYKGVRAWSRRTLEKAKERVLDIPLDDEDDEEEETTAAI